MFYNCFLTKYWKGTARGRYGTAFSSNFIKKVKWQMFVEDPQCKAFRSNRHLAGLTPSRFQVLPVSDKATSQLKPNQQLSFRFDFHENTAWTKSQNSRFSIKVKPTSETERNEIRKQTSRTCICQKLNNHRKYRLSWRSSERERLKIGWRCCSFLRWKEIGQIIERNFDNDLQKAFTLISHVQSLKDKV